MSVTYNGAAYYYVTNLQGDVIAILDGNGTQVVSYTYDAWGKLLSTDGTMATTLGTVNPLRYRGYVYDHETGLYYVSSRYYDPEIGRFINADGQISGVGGDLLGYNMFAYCMNNPVNRDDPSGDWPRWITKKIIKAVTGIVVLLASYVATRNLYSSIQEPNFDAVDELLDNRVIEENNVHLPEDKEGLLYNKENREYASEIIKNDLGDDTCRTVKNISSEIFAHQIAADFTFPLAILSKYVPRKYDIHGRLSEADIDEQESRIEFFDFMEAILEWE